MYIIIIFKDKTYLSSACPSADVKRDVVDEKPIFRRLDRFRLSAIVSSLIGESRLYRPTPTA